MMRYYVLCMRISNVSIYVRTEMYTNNKCVSTLIWKRCFHTDMKTSRSIVCKTNMHLIMRIENAFAFYCKLIHFYNERASFLFYCENGKRGAVSWLSLNAVEVRQTSHLLDVCRFRLFLWQFDGFFWKLLEDLPLSSIFNTADFVHSACTSASVVYGATRLDSM
jgi:hypothetical protein